MFISQDLATIFMMWILSYKYVFQYDVQVVLWLKWLPFNGFDRIGHVRGFLPVFGIYWWTLWWTLSKCRDWVHQLALCLSFFHPWLETSVGAFFPDKMSNISITSSFLEASSMFPWHPPFGTCPSFGLLGRWSLSLQHPVPFLLSLVCSQNWGLLEMAWALL